MSVPATFYKNFDLEKDKINYAPIVLFAYNRPKHTLQVLQSLQRNKEAAFSDLIIFIDGLKANFTKEDEDKRAELIKYCESEKWCKNVQIHVSPVNKGLSRSVTEGITKVLDQYGKVIALEDDLICDDYFLSFMNRALDLYKEDEEVACISGYIYPVKDKLPATFFIKGADCWGWGTWRRAWKIYELDGKVLLSQIQKKQLQNEFDFNGSYPYTQMLSDQIEGKNNSWAIRWYASAFLQSKYCLYPGQSLIHNTGNDGSGTHAAENEKFDTQLKNQAVEIKKIEIKTDQQAYAAITHYFLEAFSKNAVQQKENILKKIYRKLVPEGLRKDLYELRNPIKEENAGWFGNYKNWEEVKKECIGYDSEAIFEKVKQATLKVKNGEAAFERDSVTFDKIEFDEKLLNLFKNILKENNKLSVLDFGGALGSVYFQYRQLLDKDADINWNVVEQGHFVEFGQKELQNKELYFYYTPQEVVNKIKKDVLLLSSVLSYLEEPYKMLNSLMDLSIKYIVIDRNLFLQNEERLTKQIVPRSIYEASYPCRILNEKKTIEMLSSHYTVVDTLDPYNGLEIDLGDKKAYFKGHILKLK